MQTDLETLRVRILKTAKASSVGKQIEDIVLESGQDDDGADFLRVVIQVKHRGLDDDTALESLLESIEDVVGALDERYPSVRFLDAA